METDIEECVGKGSCANCPNRNTTQSCSISPCGGHGSVETYDVIIIGAGVVGCAIARLLASLKVRVLVLEKDNDVAQGASKANSGIVHGGYSSRHGTLKAKLGFRGNMMFSQLNRELNFGFRQVGSLVLAFSEQEKKGLLEEMENGVKNGVTSLRLLDREEVIAIEPHVNPNVVAALYCPDAGIVSPYEYCIALAENAAANGVEFQLNHEVFDIQKLADGRMMVSTRPGRYTGRYVINAAGLMSDKIAAMVGANNFTILPRKGEYLILSKSQGHLARHVLFPVPSDKGKGILVSQTYHGNLLLGPTARDSASTDLLTNEQIVKYIVHTARGMVGGIDLSETIASYAGLRARSGASSGGDFIIEMSCVPGFINVAGIDSPGLTSSPAIAEYVFQILQDHGARFAPNPNFNPIRSPIIVPKDTNFNGTIDDTDPHKNIICRCERVTEAEIVEAISHRPIVAATTDAVKKRTRAGMGQCQGKFCGERVAKLIARETHIPLELVPRRSAGSSLLPPDKVAAMDMLAKL
eukprot:c26580_g1_i1.p1 GENE.c26580_g1_i1~~c26580_g1_i1.p1  ORF type:complete len:535 (-),score=125.61 c26580_g1_i1:209-1780(-)